MLIKKSQMETEDAYLPFSGKTVQAYIQSQQQTQLQTQQLISNNGWVDVLVGKS